MTGPILNFKDYFFSTYHIPFGNISNVSGLAKTCKFSVKDDISLNLYFPGENQIIVTCLNAQIILQSFDRKHPTFDINNTLTFDIGVFNYDRSDEIIFSNTVNNKNGAYTKSILSKMLKKDFSCFDFISNSKELFLKEIKHRLSEQMSNDLLDTEQVNPTLDSIKKITTRFSEMLHTVNHNFSNNQIEAYSILRKLTPLEKENLHIVLKESQIVRLQNLLEQELKASGNKSSRNKI